MRVLRPKMILANGCNAKCLAVLATNSVGFAPHIYFSLFQNKRLKYLEHLSCLQVMKLKLPNIFTATLAITTKWPVNVQLQAAFSLV